jgi:hypothetical protein
MHKSGGARETYSPINNLWAEPTFLQQRLTQAGQHLVLPQIYAPFLDKLLSFHEDISVDD